MENFEVFAEAPGGVKRLRELVLELAMDGRLTGQERETYANVGQIASFRQDLLRPSDMSDEEVVFVGPQHIERDSGRRIGCDAFHASQLSGRKFRFSPGEIVYTYLRPYLNKVWVADFDGVCSVDQYVLRVQGDSVSARYLQLYMLSPSFLKETDRLTNGLMLPRLRSGLLSKIEIPLPPPTEQNRIVAKIEQLMSMLDDFEQRQTAMRSTAADVSKAFLDSFVRPGIYREDGDRSTDGRG